MTRRETPVGGEQVGGQAILPWFYVFASQHRLIQTKMSRLPWGYRDEEEGKYIPISMR